MTEQLMTAATIFLMLFGAVAAVDGLYFHLWKYKLYARPESLYEHKLHTARAFLFIPVVFFLFYMNSGGVALWVGVAFVLIEFVVEMMDVFDENESRAGLGGLSSAEYAAHVVAITVRTAAIALALAAKPLAAWSLSAPFGLEEQFSFVSTAAFQIITGNLIVGALHIWLMRGKYQTQTGVLPIRACC